LNYGRLLNQGTQGKVKAVASDKPNNELNKPENERVEEQESNPMDVDSSGMSERHHGHPIMSEHDWMKHGRSSTNMGSEAHLLQHGIQGEHEVHQEGHTVAKPTLPMHGLMSGSPSEGGMVHDDSQSGDNMLDHGYIGHEMAVATHYNMPLDT
jgi:hypothetical protein